MERGGTSWQSPPPRQPDGGIGGPGAVRRGKGYARLSRGGRCGKPGGGGVVLGRGGVDPALGGQGPDRELLDEALTAIAIVATRLRAEQQRRGRLELEVERLEGSVGLLEERIDEAIAAVHAAIRDLPGP